MSSQDISTPDMEASRERLIRTIRNSWRILTVLYAILLFIVLAPVGYYDQGCLSMLVISGLSFAFGIAIARIDGRAYP